MRGPSLILAVLLLTGVFAANTAQASDADFLLQLSAPTLASSETADCQAELPEGAPSPLFATAGTGCGPCSDSYCRGSAIGNGCSKGMYYTCQNAYGLECPTDPTVWKCTCWAPGVPFP